MSRISTSFWSRIGAGVEAVVGPEDREPVRVSPWMIGQLMELGPRWSGQQRWVVLDRAVRGQIEDLLGDDQRHVRHHAQVGLQARRIPPAPRSLCETTRGWMHGQVPRERRLLQRIDPPAALGRLGRAVDGDHVLPALQQRLQHAPAERLLPVDHDAHVCFLPTASIAQAGASARAAGSIASSARTAAASFDSRIVASEARQQRGQAQSASGRRPAGGRAPFDVTLPGPRVAETGEQESTSTMAVRVIRTATASEIAEPRREAKAGPRRAARGGCGGARPRRRE